MIFFSFGKDSLVLFFKKNTCLIFYMLYYTNNDWYFLTLHPLVCSELDCLFMILPSHFSLTNSHLYSHANSSVRPVVEHHVRIHSFIWPAHSNPLVRPQQTRHPDWSALPLGARASCPFWNLEHGHLARFGNVEGIVPILEYGVRATCPFLKCGGHLAR